MNGLETEQTLLLLNGSKLNSYQNAQIDLSLISKDNIERIEVVNNGYSSLYGSDAIGGVVNIITTRNKGIFTANLRTEAGSYNYRKIYLDVNNNVGSLSMNVGVSSESSDDDFDYYYNTGQEKILKTRANNSYTFQNVFADLDMKLSKDQSISYYTNLTSGKNNTPGLETGTAPANTKQDDRNWNNIIVYNNSLNEKFSLRSEGNFQNNLMNYYDEPYINSYYKNIVLANRSQVDHKSGDFSLAAGYDFTYATVQSNEIESDINRFQTGLFIATEITPFKNVKIFPSARFDNVSDIDQTNAAGKIGINIKPFDKTDFFIRANIGNNYAAPTFNQLYWKQGGNPNLRTQKSFNTDAGIVYKFNLIGDNVIDVNYTHINFTDKIIWQPGPNGIWSPSNIGKTQSNVFAFDIKTNKQLFKDLLLILGVNYTYASSRKKNSDYANDPTYNKQVIYLPQELSKTNLGISYKDAGLNLYYRFIGKRYTDFENTKYQPAVDILDGNVYYSYTIWKLKIRANAEINNILDTDYQIMPGYPMPLRNFKLGLSISY
jgi:iron complex outermembrane receptor protein